VKEAYAELNAPVIRDVAFVNLLELNGAVRLSDYSTTGSTTTFKGGVNWKPIKDLRLRGSYAEGFRAPSIGELFGTISRFDQTIDDPCAGASAAPRNFVNDATVRANCIAQGVPANGSYAEQNNAQLAVIVSGNENLKPETSKSWIFGGVYSPSFLPGFSIEVNHYNIRLKDAIQAVDASVTLNNCVLNNDPASCALVTRSFSGSGQVVQISGIIDNIAAVRTKGIDLNVTYRAPKTSIGRFGLTWNNTFLRNFDLILPGGLKISREGTEQGSPSQGFPKWKSIGILDWDLAEFGATITGRYISKLKERDLAPPHSLNAKFYTDLQLRWTPGFLNEQVGLALGVNNLFKTKAPGCITCDLNNFDPTMYDLPGRYFYARLSAKLQ
jgi:iron complex outermembrane receptor protein